MEKEQNTIEDDIKNATKRVMFIGTNPINEFLIDNATELASLLKLQPDLKIYIFNESSNENFIQAIALSLGEKEIRFSQLEQRKARIVGNVDGDSGLLGLIQDAFSIIAGPADLASRFIVKQLNLRLPANLIIIDDTFYCCTTFASLPSIDSYKKIEKDSEEWSEIYKFIEANIVKSDANLFHSKLGDELIWVFDSDDFPRTIAPRSSFYTTDYGRRVVWVLVFNRKGELLLQQRSKKTKDNRLMWDKSIGGHVDLADSSTAETAKRELIEEIYLPNAEFTRYVKADLGEIVNFGELNFRKRPERHLIKEILALGETDWAMFRATDTSGVPIKVRRASERTIHDNDNKISLKKTIFHAELFVMIAPQDQFDDLERAQSEIPSGEFSAVSDRMLVTPELLSAMVKKKSPGGHHKKFFTDDLLFINSEYRDIIDRVSEFIKFMSKVGH